MGLALVLMVVCMAVSLHVERSRFGMSLLAIKQNEPAAEAAGVDALRWKMLAMMLRAAMAAADGLYAVAHLIVTPRDLFGVTVSSSLRCSAASGSSGAR